MVYYPKGNWSGGFGTVVNPGDNKPGTGVSSGSKSSSSKARKPSHSSEELQEISDQLEDKGAPKVSLAYEQAAKEKEKIEDSVDSRSQEYIYTVKRGKEEVALRGSEKFGKKLKESLGSEQARRVESQLDQESKLKKIPDKAVTGRGEAIEFVDKTQNVAVTKVSTGEEVILEKTKKVPKVRDDLIVTSVGFLPKEDVKKEFGVYKDNLYVSKAEVESSYSGQVVQRSSYDYSESSRVAIDRREKLQEISDKDYQFLSQTRKLSEGAAYNIRSNLRRSGISLASGFAGGVLYEGVKKVGSSVLSRKILTKLTPVGRLAEAGVASFVISKEVASASRKSSTSAQLGSNIAQPALSFLGFGAGVKVVRGPVNNMIWEYKTKRSMRASTDYNWNPEFKTNTTYVPERAMVDFTARRPSVEVQTVKISQRSPGYDILPIKEVPAAVPDRPLPRQTQFIERDPLTLVKKSDPRFDPRTSTTYKEAKALKPKEYQTFLDDYIKKGEPIRQTTFEFDETPVRFQLFRGNKRGSLYGLQQERSYVNPNKRILEEAKRKRETSPFERISADFARESKPITVSIGYTIHSRSQIGSSVISQDISDVRVNEGSLVDSYSLDVRQEPSLRVSDVNIADISTGQDQGIKQDFRQNQKIKEDLDFVPDKKISKRSKTPQEPLEFRRRLPEPISGIPSLSFKGSKPLSEGGYDVFIRRSGRFELAQRDLGKSDAFSFGSKLVDRTAAATFKVMKGNQSITDFSDPKFEKKGGLFIEKNKFRIDTQGELFDITYKGSKLI